MTAGWLVRRELGRPSELRLICFPYAGRGASLFSRWQALVPIGVEVIAVQLPGRETRIREPAGVSLCSVAAQISAQLLQQRAVPCILLGHSMGGILAFEVCRRLERAGQSPAGLVVSASPPPNHPVSWPGLADASDEALSSKLTRLGGTPAAILEHPELRALALRIFRSDLRLLESYQGVPLQPVATPIRALCGTTDPEVTAERMSRWRAYTTASFSIEAMEGDHYFVETQREQLIARVTDRVSSPWHSLFVG